MTALTLENLGNVYMRQKEYGKTLELLDEVLAIRESALGADSVQAARTRFNMGVVANSSGDFARAFALIDAGLRVFRQQYGERSIEAAIGFLHRGMTNESLERNGSALRDYASSLAILDTLGTPPEATRIKVLDRMGSLQCRQGQIDRGRATADLALGALDRKNADHQKWIDRFEAVRASCGAGG